MDVQMRLGDLVDALRRVACVINTRDKVAEFRHAHIGTSPDGVVVTGAGPETWVRVTCRADAVHKDGAALVRARNCVDALERIGDDDAVVRMTVEDGRLTLCVGDRIAYAAEPGRARAQDYVLGISENLRTRHPLVVCTVTRSELARVVHMTAPATSTDPLRITMQGVYLHGDGSDLYAVASDGHWLVRTRVAMYPGATVLLDPKEDGAIVRRETWRVLPRVFSGRRGRIHLTAGATAIVAELEDGSIRVEALNIVGPYPRYRLVLPQYRIDVDPHVHVHAGDLRRALDALRLGQEPSGPDAQVRVHIMAHVGKMTITRGALSRTVVCWPDNKQVSMYVDANLFLRMLRTAPQNGILRITKGEKSDMIEIVVIDEPGNQYHIVMAMRA